MKLQGQKARGWDKHPVDTLAAAKAKVNAIYTLGKTYIRAEDQRGSVGMSLVSEVSAATDKSQPESRDPSAILNA
jgi:hypothetical protein